MEVVAGLLESAESVRAGAFGFIDLVGDTPVGPSDNVRLGTLCDTSLFLFVVMDPFRGLVGATYSDLLLDLCPIVDGDFFFFFVTGIELLLALSSPADFSEFVFSASMDMAMQMLTVSRTGELRCCR